MIGSLRNSPVRDLIDASKDAPGRATIIRDTGTPYTEEELRSIQGDPSRGVDVGPNARPSWFPTQTNMGDSPD